MYKVFIQNRPIIFVSTDEMIEFDGLFIHEERAISAKDEIINSILNFPKSLILIVICKNPIACMGQFFSGYDQVEAAGGIVQKNNKYLFIYRNETWDIPKGLIEEGENIEQAALREVVEECGVDQVAIQQLITKTFHVYEFNGQPTIKKTYWYSMISDSDKELVPQLEEGITKAEWLTEDAIMELKSNMYGSIQLVVEQFFDKKI